MQWTKGKIVIFVVNNFLDVQNLISVGEFCSQSQFQLLQKGLYNLNNQNNLQTVFYRYFSSFVFNLFQFCSFPYQNLKHLLNWRLKLIVSCLVLATREEFENEGFTLKTNEMFSVHTSPEEYKNTTIFSPIGFVFAEPTRSGKWSNYSGDVIILEKRRLCGFVHTKRNVVVLKFLRLEERFQKSPFSKCLPPTRKRPAGVY